MKILFKTLTLYYSILSFVKRKVLIRNIKKDDLVLDVGSGDKPHWRADVIVDKFPDDNRQRISGKILIDKRKIFINADVENLPFKDKSFDFVFCSHLLEHVGDLDKAIAEITRVGKRGYLEVPSAVLEILQPFKTHLWLCNYDGKTLIFTQKENQPDFQGKIMANFGQRCFNLPSFQYLLARDFRFFFICLYWQKVFNYQIVKAKHPYVYFYEGAKENDSLGHSNFYKFFYLAMRLLFYRKKEINLSLLIKNQKSPLM